MRGIVTVADMPAELHRERAEVDRRRKDLQPRIPCETTADEERQRRAVVRHGDDLWDGEEVGDGNSDVA